MLQKWDQVNRGGKLRVKKWSPTEVETQDVARKSTGRVSKDEEKTLSLSARSHMSRKRTPCASAPSPPAPIKGSEKMGKN